MDRILIVSGNDRSSKLMKDCLSEFGFVHIDTQQSGSSSRRLLIDREYDLVIINPPLKDEAGEELAAEICTKSASGVIMAIKAEDADAIAEKMESYGVLVISKPFSKTGLYQSVKFVLASVRRMQNISREKDKLQKRVEDIKIIDRAKWLLIERLHMTEQDAHRHIEKAAMDKRMTRREVAEKIISSMEV
ncbi:MAG: ANTAR domain-containing protein [Bacillota bacterium]|nr:ANTAR domain-containing protein [Bacillota bacterium]